MLIAAFFVILYPAFVIQFGVNYLKITNVDLPSFWCAAEAAFEHQASPYERDYLQTLLPAQHGYLMMPETREFPHQYYVDPEQIERHDQHVFPFLHAPPSLLVFFPLSLLSYEHARVATLVLNHLLVLFLLWFVPVKIIGLSPRSDTLSVILGMAYVLVFYPMVIVLNHGQVNLILAAALCLFWYWIRNDRPALAGFGLVVSILLKTYPVVLLLFLLVCRKFRALFYSTALLALALIVSFVWLPDVLWEEWLGRILPTGGYASTPAGLFSPAAIWNQSLNGFISRLFLVSKWSPEPLYHSPRLAKLLCYLANATLVGASAAAVYFRYGRSHARAFDWAMLLFFPLMFLIAPFAWEHHLVYVLISVLVLLAAAVEYLDGRTVIAVLIFACAMVMAIQGIREVKFFAVFGLWAVTLYLAFMDDRAFPGETIAPPSTS